MRNERQSRLGRRETYAGKPWSFRWSREISLSLIYSSLTAEFRENRSQSEHSIVVASMLGTRIDLKVYGLTAIKKAAYRLANRCTVVFGEVEGDAVSLSFQFGAGTNDAAATEAVRLFHQELLDEDLRERIHRDTDALRALILAHTFSKTDLIERQ